MTDSCFCHLEPPAGGERSACSKRFPARSGSGGLLANSSAKGIALRETTAWLKHSVITPLCPKILVRTWNDVNAMNYANFIFSALISARLLRYLRLLPKTIRSSFDLPFPLVSSLEHSVEQHPWYFSAHSGH